jgi:sugar O-acyltransferase (sialic acid O-acetyltransferase NeuD family)
MEPLVLIGGGGHCKSVIEAAESAGCTILGILDMPEEMGKTVLGYPVIGTDDDIPRYVGKAEFLITLGFIMNPSARIRLYNKVKQAGGTLAVVIASTANVSRHAILGEGTVVLHQATVNAGACIGENCIINTAANIEHDVVIGAQTHVSTGVMVNGGSKIGERTFVGSQSMIANGVTITDDCIIGAGSNITKDLLQSGIYWGNPAKYVSMKVNECKIGGG